MWTLIRNEALCNESLAEIGFSNGLDTYVTRNNSTISISKKMIATAMEAVLGAVHLDGGDDTLAPVTEHLRIVNPFNTVVILHHSLVNIYALQIYCSLSTLTSISLFYKRLDIPSC